MIALFLVLDTVLETYKWVLIVSVIFSWLYAFNIVNPGNQVVGTIGSILYQLTEPVLRPIRRFLPDLGAIDISPIILFLIIYFLQLIIRINIIPALAF
ncbi:MAG: YggT family protein [Nitratireductor sp.]|nr:YggT family protein [Nitratireductor sp.]